VGQAAGYKGPTWFPFAFRQACPYNAPVDSQAIVLCETEKSYGWYPGAGNPWFHGTSTTVCENELSTALFSWDSADEATMHDVTILGRLEELDRKLHAKALEVAEGTSTKLSRIIETFPHYTSHDEKHAKRALEICEWLAGPGLLGQLNAPELFVLFSAIYLHDIGMTLEPAERTAIERSPKYQRFAETSGLTIVEALAEWVRRIHHRRSGEIVRSTHANATGIPIRDAALAHAVALICESHGESDLEDFVKYDPFYAYGTSAKTICLPLLGVLLRLSDLLHITEDRTPLAVLPLIHLTNARSKMEWSKHLSTVGVAPLPDGTIRMTCLCNDPDVHRSILRLCDYINQEFEYSKRILAKLEAAGRPKYELACCRVVPNVTALGYEPWLDLTFQIDRAGVIQLLTGSRIYHGPRAALKELLMNAVDASRQARVLGRESVPIRVEFSSTESRLSISDGGVGMDRADLEDFLLRLGRCIYRSDIYQQRYGPSQRIDALSEFGIGFASCFLVSDHVVVETKRESKDAYLLDLYDLLGFAAARKSSRIDAGTTVTLYLKQTVMEDLERAVRDLSTICPHVEIPIHVQVDGEEMDVLAQSYCEEREALLVPFFRSRATDLVVEHQHPTPEIDNVSGCLCLLCHEEDGVVVPGYADWFKLSPSDKRRVSQLGFALPEPSQWPGSLLGTFNIGALRYDLDLRGDMRLEMDPSRTSVLGSVHNAEVITRLDEHLVSYLCDLHHRHWEKLPRESRFAAHRKFGRMFFMRIMNAASFTTRAARRMADLMFDNVPHHTASKSKGSCELTWNEIRQMGVPVIFYHRFMYVAEYESHVTSILNAVPEALVVIDEPSFHYGSQLLHYCTEKQIHVSETSRRIYEVVEPWQGTADDLHAYSSSPNNPKYNPWSFLVPFIPATPYALVATSATRRSGGASVWVNASHPKIAAIVEAAKVVEKSERKVPECVSFLQFIHQSHGGIGTDPEYIDYIQQHQRQAINELANAGVIGPLESEALLLDAGDFVPWERL
jgi:hypothetical protein